MVSNAALQAAEEIRREYLGLCFAMEPITEIIDRAIQQAVQAERAKDDCIAHLLRTVAELEPRAAFGDQCYQDRCENAYVEQSVVKKAVAAERGRIRSILRRFVAESVPDTTLDQIITLDDLVQAERNAALNYVDPPGTPYGCIDTKPESR